MDDARPAIEPLSSQHDRSHFSCGEPALDHYLQRQASQDVRRRIAQVFVAFAEKSGPVGYYSLSAASFDRANLPPDLARRLPHYPVPAALLGRLAVDLSWQRRHLGEMLLMDAASRILRARAALAVHALIVDAKNDRARTFYERYGFQAFPDIPRRLFLPMETFGKAGV